MKECWTIIQLVFSAIGGWLGYFLGGWDGLVYALVVFVTVDYVTGGVVRHIRQETIVRSGL